MNQVVYKAKPTENRVVIDGDASKDFWKRSEIARLPHYMGAKPIHFPYVEAKIAYDKEGLIVLFVVHDCFVKSTHNHYQSEVWKDSCVELFFTPGNNPELGYFNLEMNCGGAALFHFNKDGVIKNVDISDFKSIEVYHSMPKLILEEIKEPIKWIIEYKIPYKMLEKYTKVTHPKQGISWLINIYKCADGSSNPHWLTWSKITYPKPNFHLPEFFGKLNFIN